MASITGKLRILFTNPLLEIERLARESDDIGRGRMQGGVVVLVNTPELAQEFLVDRYADFDKGTAYRELATPYIDDGIMISEGDHHLAQRKLVAPAFAHARMERFPEIIADLARQELRRWPAGAIVNLDIAMRRLTLAISSRSVFGGALFTESGVLGRDYAAWQRHFAWRLRSHRRVSIPGFRATRARVDAELYALIRTLRDSGEDRGDLLSMLILSREEGTARELTDREVRDEAMTLLVAGHETTAHALLWAWYLLARHPQVFRRLREESGYGLLVFKEAMRLYPPVDIIGRSALRDTRIGTCAIYAGETVLVSPWLLHRSARYFEEPLRFDPERFRPEREAKLPKLAYMPFGAGRRICIGNRLALMEGQKVLETMAPQIDLQLISPKPESIEVSKRLRPRGGVRVKVSRLG